MVAHQSCACNPQCVACTGITAHSQSTVSCAPRRASSALCQPFLHGRCFPKFPAEFTNNLYSMVNTTSGAVKAVASTAQTTFSSGGSTFGNYVADISKGILIIVIGGLACGMALSLVRSFTLLNSSPGSALAFEYVSPSILPSHDQMHHCAAE